ncbi:MAG: hypothetical protein Kow0075_07300 [Salibacteraceae bacterium]
MKNLKKTRPLVKSIIGMVAALFCCATTVVAQTPEMADTMRSSGKIYVVVGVVVIIFAVLFSYIFYLERRLSKIEKTLK